LAVGRGFLTQERHCERVIERSNLPNYPTDHLSQ